MLYDILVWFMSGEWVFWTGPAWIVSLVVAKMRGVC